MYRLSLDNTRLNEHPLGFESLTCVRAVSETYHGFLRKNTAFVQSSADSLPQLTFEETTAYQILISAWNEDKLKASVTLNVYKNEVLEFSALVDYASATWDKHSFTCTFKDNETVSNFLSSSETSYKITPTERLLLRSKNIENQIRLSIPENELSIRKKTKRTIRPFRLPFQSESGQTEDKAFYYVNETSNPQELQIDGKLKGSFTGFGTISISLEEQSSHKLTSKTNSTDSESLLFSISKRFTLNAGQGFYVEMQVTTKDITATIDESSYLQIQVLADYPDSYVSGLNAENLLLALAQKGNPNLTLSVSSNLSKKLQKAFITSGKNIRGYSSAFTATFEEVFKSIDSMFAIRLDLEDENLNLSKFIEDRSSLTFEESKVRNINYFPLSELAFSSLNFGYQNWKSDDYLGSLEYNSNRSYSSGLSGYGNLDKSIGLNASGLTIESLRRLQFSEDENQDKDNKSDEELFVVSASSTGVNTYEQDGTKGFTDILNVFDLSGTPTNLAYLPERLLQNWAPQLKAATSTLEFTSGEGNLDVVSKAKDESVVLSSQGDISLDAYGLSGEVVELEVESSLQEYNSLPDVISYIDGTETKKALLQYAEMPFNENEPIMIIRGYVLG